MRIFKYFSLVLLLWLVFAGVAAASPVDEAQQMFKARKYDKCIEFLQDEIKKDSRFHELYYWLGRCYLEKEDYEQAEKAFDECLDRKGNYDPAKAYLGLTYVYEKKFDEAKKILEKGAAKSKDYRGLFDDNLGHYYVSQGDFNNADINFRKALIEEPNNIEYQRDLADMNYENEVYAVAIEMYKKILEIDSTDVETYFKLGRAEYKQRQFSDALQNVSKAIEFDSSYTPAYNMMGDIFMITGLSALNETPDKAQDFFKNAVWAYEKFLSTGGKETAEIDYRLGQASYYVHAYETAVNYLDKAIAGGIDKSQAYDQKAKALFRLHRFDEAIQAYKDYEQKITGGDPNFKWTPEYYDFFKERAITLFQLYLDGKKEGDADSTLLEQAVPNYEQAIKLKDIDPQLYVQLGLSYYYLGEYEKAIPWFQKKIEAEPDVYNTYLNLAFALLKLNRDAEAMQEMIKVTELKPDYLPAYETIANTYMHTLHEREKGMEWYRKWAQADPKAYQPYKWLGFAYVSAKPPQKDKAVENLNKAIEKMKANGVDICKEIDVITWLAQAHSFYETVEHDNEALKWANQGLKCDPNNETLKNLKESLE